MAFADAEHYVSDNQALPVEDANRSLTLTYIGALCNSTLRGLVIIILQKRQIITLTLLTLTPLTLALTLTVALTVALALT